ncbi:hypothetical protein [Microbispora sp. ATCC PTA-5024]|uniref:hypothetical protein n=1 Tax=Microbispora sp. ATCC PTA-5024 TaxID=316330 RepID=UPI0003DCFF41|nr:hypothetical protein [Microbispora sp. ATCC PTA-5024]ETK32497.1 hypothetical protein MPTA5024_29415 [Microbispora sp. ATCC PTA-5024]
MATHDDLVPNPRHRELEAALAAVREHLHVLETALDAACAQFGGEAVWVGPAARAFGDELQGRRARLRAAARQVLSELEAELRTTPSHVPRTAAAATTGWA